VQALVRMCEQVVCLFLLLDSVFQLRSRGLNGRQVHASACAHLCVFVRICMP